MSGWRFDVADEGYFLEPEPIKNPEPYWKPGDYYWIEQAGEQAAEQYHAENDGWEDDWPVTFHIYPPDSDEFTVVEVDREYEPVFVGSAKRKAEGDG